MNEMGMNTDTITSVIAMMAPPISPITSFTAAYGVR